LQAILFANAVGGPGDEAPGASRAELGELEDCQSSIDSIDIFVLTEIPGRTNKLSNRRMKLKTGLLRV
jgi:hypothetical protein